METVKRDFSVKVHALEPRAVYEIECEDLNRFIAWMMNPFPGENIIVYFRDECFKFSTYEERKQFALGFNRGLQIKEFVIEELEHKVTELEFEVEFNNIQIKPRDNVMVSRNSEIRLKAVDADAISASQKKTG